MVDFPGNVKNAVNKRIADDTIQQFQIGEFTVSCKELTLKRAILVHESNFTIYESEYRGSVVAVKVVAVEETHQISNYIDAVVDLTSFAALSQDNISSFLGAGYTLNSENKLREIMIVTEPYERGTLRSLLKKSLDWQTKITLARDVARAISFLHDKSVIHGDIRISTILVNDQNQAKLVDFAHLCGERSRLETRTFNTTKGTVALSPEMARNHMYDFAADVYAFGMLLFELITEIPPNKNFRYRNAHGGFALLESELRAAVKPGCPAALEALAYSCCETKALRRVVAPQIVEELDFILIELNRKPEEEVRPSPLRRASSTTNKYAHLLLPSPGSMKQLLPAKAAPAGAENTVSTPSVDGKITSLPQTPAVVDAPTPAVAENAESEGDAAVLSVPLNKEVREIREAENAQPVDDTVTPSAGPAKAPQRRTALPLTPAPPVNEPLSVSASVEKSVVQPSSLLSVLSLNGPEDVKASAEKEPKSTPTAPEDKADAAGAGPVIVNVSKNKRRKGMFDASTAQVEDEVPQPQPASSTSTEQVAAPPVVPDVQASGTAPIVENEAWLGSVTDSVQVEVVKESAKMIAPQAEIVEPSLSASSTTSASPAVPSVPIEQTPDKKKKSRARAKIDYAGEGLAATEPAELAQPVTFVSTPSEKVEATRPPAAASSSLSATQEEKTEKLVGKAEVVSVSFELPAVPIAASTVAVSISPAAESKPDNVNIPAAAAVSATPAIPSSSPAIHTASAMTAAPAVAVAQTEAPVSAPATEKAPQMIPVKSSTKTEEARSSAPKQAPPAPTPGTAPSVPVPEAAAPAVPVLAEAASARKDNFVQPSASVVHNSPPAVSGHLAPLDDTESRLFTVYAQPNFGSEYVTLNSFSQEMKPVEEPFVTAPPVIAPSVPVALMPAAVSSPAPPVLSQFALYSASAAPVQEHAPAASTKAVRPGGGRRDPGAEAQPVPIPASIRALGEPEVVPAIPVKSAPSPAVVTPAVVEATSSEKSQERKSASNIVPETFKQHIRAFVETPERKKAVSAVDNRDAGLSAGSKDKSIREHSPVRLDPSPLVLSTPQADKTHTSNGFTDIFSPLSPVAAPASAPASSTGAATVSPTPEGRVLSKKKSRSRNKLTDKTLTPSSSFVLKSSPVIPMEPSVSSPVPPQNSSAPASPQPLSLETTELFASPSENDPESKSPKPLNSNQKRRQNRAQARAAAAAFAAAAIAAQEVVEGPQKERASESDFVEEEVPTEKAIIIGTMESAEKPVIVYTPKYAPPPVPVAAAPTSIDSSNNLDKKAESVQENVPEEFHSPPRYSAAHTPNSHTATGLETPPSKAHHSPSRTPNGSLPVPAPHRHVHHFDLPAPQVTPPMHFPLSGAVSLVPLPTPPESPSIPLPHKQEPAEAVQQVFSDADVKIATGSPQTKVAAQAQAQVYSTPHRTVEKINRFNVLASADADSSHQKTLRMKVLSPAAASQKAVLSAPAPVVTAPVVNAYEERLLMMEQRLQALAEENLALQKELQVAVTRPQVVPATPAPASAAMLPVVVDNFDAPSTPQMVTEEEERIESEEETESDLEAAGVMQERETIAEPVAPARAPTRSNFGAMFRDFDETNAEAVSSTPLAVQNSQISSTSSQQVPVPGRASFTQELPVVSVVSSVAPPATPTGFVNALKNLEAIQTDLRSKLQALNVPPVFGAANTVAEVEGEKISGEEEEDVEIDADSSVDAAEDDGTTVHVTTEPLHDSSAVKALSSTTAPQEVTPSTSTNAPSTAEAEQQLQAHIASAIDSKLGAVQAQIAQFSSLLNAILLAQSPQPQRAAHGDDASQLNSSSTHTSAFVTPNSIMTVNSTALGLEIEEGGPGGSPSSSTLGPQKLFSQIDQQAEFQDLSPLAHSSSTDSGCSETHVLLRPSNLMQSSSAMPETGSFVPHSQVIWTTLDPTNPSVEPFSPTSDEGNISEDPPSKEEERDDDNNEEEEEEDQDQDIAGHEDIAPPTEVLDVVTHKPTFASSSTAREVENSTVSEEERNVSSPGSPVAPPVPTQLHASPPANRLVSVSPAVNANPATKPSPAKFLLEPLEEIIETPDVVPTSNSSENTYKQSPDMILSAIIPKILLEEVPLEAWEVKARRASTTTAVELPVPKPVHEGETKKVHDTKPETVASVNASPQHSERTPSVKEAAPVASAPAPAVSKPEPPVVQDKIAPAEIVIPVTAAEPSSSVSTPRSRATSPFLRNRIPYPAEAQEGAPLQFPHLFGEPEADPAAEPVEVPEAKAEEKEMSESDGSSVVPGDYAPFSPAREGTQQVSLREPMKIPGPPAEDVPNSPAVSVGSRSTGESSSVVDTTDIEYPYSAEEYAQARHTPPQTLLNRSLTPQPLPLLQAQGLGSAAVQALHRHHEQQQRELLFQQEQQLQAKLSAFGHQSLQQVDHSSYLIPNAHHHNVHRSPAKAFNSSTLSVQSALSIHSHHQHSPPPPPRLPSPHPSSPPAQGLASSMKFLDQINRLKDHYDAKDDGQLSQVPQRKPLDYTKSPPPAQVELRRPQAGQPHIEKHLHVSPSSSMERIGDGYQPQSLYPVSTAHAQRLNPRSTHGAFHALRASSPPPPLPRPLMHSDPYLDPHSYEAGNNSFRSPSPPRIQGTPQQQIHTQSTLTNSGGERARRQHEYAQQMSYPLPSSPPDEEWEEEEEEEQVDPRNAQRLETLTGALNNFLSVIEKCTEISESADLAVSRLDNNMNRLDQRSHRKILSTAERGAEGSDRRSRSRERSDSLASTGKSASFAPQLSFYEPSPPPSQPSTLSRYNSFRNGSTRLNDDVYDAKYVDNYEDSDDDDKRTTLSRAGSMAARSRSNSNANVFDSTSSITREPVHTKHFLSPSVKPTLTQFNRADSTHSLTASNSFRNGNITSSNNYFKAAVVPPLPPNSPGGVNLSNRSVVSNKSPSAVRKPEGLPSRKAPVPVQKNRKVAREEAPEPRRTTRADRATSFASMAGSVVSGLSSVGGGERAPASPRPITFTADLRRSADSDSILIDGRVHTLRPKTSSGMISIQRQDSNDSEWTSTSRGRSQASSPGASGRAPFNSRSPRSRSGSPRMGSPVEIQSKNKNATVYSFRRDASPRRAY